MFLLENTSFNLLHFSYCLQKRGRHTPNSSQTPVPSAKKLKRSSPSPTLREQLTSSASGSTSDNNEAPSLSLSELSSILSRGNLSQDQLAQLTQTMLSHLHPSPAAIRKDKMKRTIACIELSSDGEEVLSLKKVCFIYSSFPRTDFLT